MMSPCSTRGVTFKFKEGERILCYEPDPTKTKVLYESKVLDVYVNRDERGRKVPEYLIHFFGWNSSWDRYVREEFILPYTEENCELQAKLATEAALTIKGKRKIKLPPLIKETLAKKQCTEAAKLKPEKNESSAVANSDSDSSDEEGEKEIIIDIPDILKSLLVEDNTLITRKNKLIRLPCKPNVICILEDFVRHFARKLLCASPPKNSKNGEQLMPEDVENKFNLCKETMDGLRIYFDFTLPQLLLYSQEQSQYRSQAISCLPVSSSYKWESQETFESVPIKIEKPDVEIPLNHLKSIAVEKPEVKLEVDTAVPSRSPSRKSLRSHSAMSNSPPVKQDNIPNGEPEVKAPLTEKVKKEEKQKKKEKPKLVSTRILRSGEKQKSQEQQPKEEAVCKSPPISSPPPPIPEVETKRASPVCPTLTISLEPRNIRVTRKSTLQNMSPPRISSPTLPTPSAQLPTESKVIAVPSAPAVKLGTNCISSSNSSSYSTFSNQANNNQFHLVNNEAMLQDILLWRLLPSHLYETIPAAPSLVYGAQHLLRLFVKLPELLCKMNISKKKIAPLLNILNTLLQFMAEKRNELFNASEYCADSGEQHRIDAHCAK